MKTKASLQIGMSLVELMVALALGAFLILGVVNVLVSSKDSGQVETSLARLQENGRIALDLMVADIRDAQHMGCNPGTVVPMVMASGVSWNGLAGYERLSAGWEPLLPAALSGLTTVARLGSDVLNLQHGASQGGAMTANVTATSNSIALDGNPECLKKGDLMLLSSCATAAIFAITNEPGCTPGAKTLNHAAAANTPATFGTTYNSNTDDLLQFFDKPGMWLIPDAPERLPIFRSMRCTVSSMASPMR